jgi:hypothetical protein
MERTARHVFSSRKSFWQSENQPNGLPGHALRWATIAACLFAGLCSAAAAQVSVTTYHNDNARTGQNTAETVLTPANVNTTQFGKLFTGGVSLDSWSAAQPLYVPKVKIDGVAHNVVYVATLNNSIYAFDADSGALLWTNNYGPPTPYANLCLDSGYAGSPSAGAGIVGTPVIDPMAGIIYFVAKTGNGSSSPFALNLHAVDIATGFDAIGSPVAIVPPSGPAFLPEYHMNRPALLLNNGMVYVALGSTGCKGLKTFPRINNHGWVLGYDTASLSTPPAVFVTTPAVDNGGIWQSGGGVAADSEGNLYFETADAVFDKNTGGEDFGDSVIKLNSDLSFADYFTPYNQGTLLDPQDLDLGSTSPVVLPDQSVAPIHLLVASGKAEEVYLLNRDSMGEYCANCSTNTNIVQDVATPPSLTGCLQVNNITTCTYGAPAYWNNQVYFPSLLAPMLAYTLTNNGTSVTLSSLPTSQTTGTYSGVGPASISSNGTSNAIAWSITWGNGNPNISNGALRAFDANNLATQFYNSDQAANKRDTLGKTARYITPTVANGRVYAATQTQLVAYGLLTPLNPTGGNNQSGVVNTTLPLPLTVRALSPYTGKPVAGISVTFSDSNAGGSFGTPSAKTDKNGDASSTYTLPTKAGSVVITASASAAVAGTFNVTATPGPVATLTLVSGGGQSATVATTLPQPIIVSARDTLGNVIPGLSITFADGSTGGSFSPNPATTAANGQASVSYTLPTKAGNIAITASTASLQLNISEKAVGGPPASMSYVSGNRQSAGPNTPLLNPLVVSIRDQDNNLLVGVPVTFSDNGAGGKFSSTTVNTGSNGRASVTYTTGSQAGSVSISATVSGVPPVQFVETVD